MKYKLNSYKKIFYKNFFMALILLVFWIISWGGLTAFALVGFVSVFETAVWLHVVLIIAIINLVCGFGLIYINRRFSKLLNISTRQKNKIAGTLRGVDFYNTLSFTRRLNIWHTVIAMNIGR